MTNCYRFASRIALKICLFAILLEGSIIDFNKNVPDIVYGAKESTPPGYGISSYFQLSPGKINAIKTKPVIYRLPRKVQLRFRHGFLEAKFEYLSHSPEVSISILDIQGRLIIKQNINMIEQEGFQTLLTIPEEFSKSIVIAVVSVGDIVVTCRGVVMN